MVMSGREAYQTSSLFPLIAHLLMIKIKAKVEFFMYELRLPSTSLFKSHYHYMEGLLLQKVHNVKLIFDIIKIVKERSMF